MEGPYSKFIIVLGAVWLGIAITIDIAGNHREVTLSLLLALGVLVIGYLSWEARKLKRNIEEKDGRIKAHESDNRIIKARERILQNRIQTLQYKTNELRKARMNREDDR